MELLKRTIRKRSPRLYELLKRLIYQLIPIAQQSRRNPDSINSYYLITAPSPQNALDIFKGEWSSLLPPPFDHLQAGGLPLFEDMRIKWLITELGDLHGRHILELGPLEGGHSYMMELAGAESVTAIDANTHAYLKCLITKELLGMRRVKFLCGDFVEYMKSPDCQQFDICVASGVLYHMINPAEVIHLLAKCGCMHLLIWTHYYDEEWMKTKGLQSKFPFAQQVEYEGFSHTLVRQYYGNATLGFCGGSRPYSNWMYREEIIKCLNYFGFNKVQINFDHYDQPHGPAFTLLASRG
jgi:SAM-dependent methyltransferase